MGKAYLSILEKGKLLGLHEEAHAEPVRRSDNDTQPIVQCAHCIIILKYVRKKLLGLRVCNTVYILHVCMSSGFSLRNTII